jgi:hypothetical protein
MQGDKTEGVGFSRRHFMQLAGAVSAAGAFGVATAGLASADTGTGTGSFTGSLAPNSGGSDARYVIAKPTGNKVTLTLVYSPYVANEAHRVGLSAWQNGKKVYHGNGQATGLKDHTNSNTVTTTLTPTAGTPLLIKVFNYSGAAVTYTLTISGSAIGFALAATHHAAEAPTAVELKGQAAGTLGGVGVATTAPYVVTKPTGNKMTITLSYSPYNAGEAHRVGFSVWQNGKRLLRETGQATGLKDHINSSQPSGSVTPTANSPVLIKVFNLNADAISYTLALS